MPAAIAPDVTSTTSRPCWCKAAICLAQLAINSTSRPAQLSVTALVTSALPTLTTRRLVLVIFCLIAWVTEDFTLVLIDMIHDRIGQWFAAIAGQA